MSQVDVPDATSSRPEVEPAVSVVMSEGNQQDISMQENSSEQSSSLDGQLENLYPSLGPPPERWHEDLTFVLENLGRNYLTDMTTEFTRDVCQRLPSLVNTMVQSLSRISGCLLSARAIAFNYEDRSSVRAYSIITESIKNCINEQTNRDDVGMFMDLAFQYIARPSGKVGQSCVPNTLTSRDDVGMFMDLAFQYIGQGFEREPRRIFPVIYSSPFWKGRPILCPKHPNFYQRVAHLNNWLVRLRPWQGLKEVTWDEIAAVVAEGNPPPFAPERVPANLTWHLDPSQWSEENVNKLYDWILDHQHRLYAGDPEAERTALQFIEDTADEPFRKEPRFDAGEYDEHAAFYYQAMQHFRFHDDIYLPLTVTRPRWFTPTLLAAWEDILTPELRALFHFVELNQLLSPHEYIGQGFEREPRRIFPVIYSSPFWKAWQGLKEVTWDEIAAVVAEGNPPSFALEHVPANLTWHLDRSQWSEENVNKLYDWILDHQHRLYAGDPEAEQTALQFIEDTADEPFCKEPRFDAGEYDEHAAFYYQAMQHFRFHDDIYLPLTVTRPRWFTPTLLAAWEDILTLELQALFHFVELNQLLSPHERSSSPYDPPLLLQMPEQDGELNTFVVPSAVYRWDDEQYNRWNILSIWQFVGMRRSLVHEGGVAGGPTGAFRVAMALFVLHRLKHEFQAGRIPVTEGMINWGPTEDQQVQQISSTLMQQIQSRIDAVDRPTIYQGSVDDQWAPTHVILKIAGSEHDLQYDWPYGSFGKHQRLTWGMGNDDPVSLRGSSSNDGDVEADVPRASVSHFGDLASQSPTSRSHEGSSEPMVLSPPRMTPTDPVPTADVALTPLVTPEMTSLSKYAADSDDDNPWQPYRANLVDTADEPFRKEPRFDAGEYDEHAVFYYQAMQHFRFHDDIYLPLTVTRPRWFTPTLLAAWEDILTPELRALFHFVELNQLLSPHERSSSPYDPPLLLQMPEQDGELNTFLNTFVVPSAVYRWDDEQYNRWNILSIWQFVGMRRSLVHEGGVAGGPTGAFRVAMALFVLHRLKHEFQAGRIPVTEGMINWGPTEDQQVQQISSTLMQQIQSRIDAVDRPMIYQGSIDNQWAPMHVILKIAGSEHDLQYDWPYGSFGKHQRLTWGMGNDDPVSLRGSSSNDGDVEADVPRASVSHFGDLASQSPTSRSHEGSSEPMVLSPPRMTPTDPVPTADVALTPLALTLPIDPTFVPIPATPLYPGRNLTQILEPPQRLPSLSDTGVVTIGLCLQSLLK
ncbi:hypothetical protein RSAG8_12694, partial [Rhizoctonia solani AG-8 WAC10335]